VTAVTFGDHEKRHAGALAERHKSPRSVRENGGLAINGVGRTMIRWREVGMRRARWRSGVVQCTNKLITSATSPGQDG
jgi:hypothetical protein